MYPVIFKIGILEARSYYLLWASALYIFMRYSSSRCVRLYGMEERHADDIVMYVCIAGVLGSWLAAFCGNLPDVINGKIAFADALQGMDSYGGMLGGGIVGISMLKKAHLSVDVFADAVAPAFALMLAVGRVGCFLEGCCYGIGRVYAEHIPWWAVHYTWDSAGFFRHPVQLYESIFCLVIWATLLAAGKTSRQVQKSGAYHALLFPFFMLSYALFRIHTSGLRALVTDSARDNAAGATWNFAVVLGTAWLFYSVLKLIKRSR